MEPLVSVIVPAYNVEKYLTECLDSIIGQTYRNIEVIIVDDGSEDGTWSIIEAYMASDQRVKGIRQANKGVGAARNNGISQATGEWLLFVDSDDFIEVDTLSRLLQETDPVEVLCFNAIAFYDFDDRQGYEEVAYNDYDIKDHLKVYDGVSFYQKYYSYAQPCLKLYRSDFIKGNHLSFPEGIIGEDIEFWLKVCIKASRIAYMDLTAYHRRYRPGSVMTSVDGDHLEDRILGFRGIMEVLGNVESGAVRRQMRRLLFDYLFNLWRQLILLADSRLIHMFQSEGLGQIMSEDISTPKQFFKYHLFYRFKVLAKHYFG